MSEDVLGGKNIDIRLQVIKMRWVSRGVTEEQEVLGCEFLIPAVALHLGS